MWKLALIAGEVLGVAFALTKAFALLEIDVASVMSAAIASGVAWLGVRQHKSLSRSYTFASHELAIVASPLNNLDDEAAWAEEVADAEEAVSREHIMWRAARVAAGASIVRPKHPIEHLKRIAEK